MSDEKRYTEQEKVMAEREAFWRGATEARCRHSLTYPKDNTDYTDYRALAQNLYPLMVPREIKTPKGVYRIVNGELHYRGDGGLWLPSEESLDQWASLGEAAKYLRESPLVPADDA